MLCVNVIETVIYISFLYLWCPVSPCVLVVVDNNKNFNSNL